MFRIIDFFFFSALTNVTQIHYAEQNLFLSDVTYAQMSHYCDNQSWDIVLDVSLHSDYVFHYTENEKENEEIEYEYEEVV